jgi:ribosomal protein L36
MKFWELQKFCHENSYSVKREGKLYVWTKNQTNRTGTCETLVETYEEIKNDIEKRISNVNSIQNKSPRSE